MQPPKSIPNPSAPQMAAERLRTDIRGNKWLPGHALPSLDSLAQKAGVSRFTMWKAVQILKQQKVLVTRRGGAIKIAGTPESSLQFRYQFCAQKISEAIYNGEYLPGTILPSTVKLQLRFSACYKTVHQALQTLARQGVVAQAGTRYAVPRSSAAASAMGIVFFTESIISENQGLLEMIHTAEQVANRLGVHFLLETCSISRPVEAGSIRRLIKDDMVAGFIFDYWGLGSDERKAHFESLLALLYASEKPVVIIDHLNDLALPEPYRSSRRIGIVSIAGAIAGEEAGRSLLRLGHKRAAFITTSANPAWSQQRYNGLVRAFAGAGIPESNISRHFTTVQLGVAPAVCVAAGLSQTQMSELLESLITPNELDDLQRNRRGFTRQFKLTAYDIKRVRRLAGTMRGLIKAEESGPRVGAIRANLLEMIADPYTFRFHEPLFNTLIADSSATAWVAATDGIGFVALAFLNSKRIALPGKLSLIAFDNSLRATAEHLTSYDFDPPGMLHTAMSFITSRPGAPLHNRRIIEWPGILMIRKTTGRARNPATP